MLSVRVRRTTARLLDSRCDTVYMSPDSEAIKWIALGLTLLQTAVAILQLMFTNGRAKPTGTSEALDRSVRLGLTLLPVAVAAILVIPHMPSTAEEPASTTMATVAIILGTAGPTYAGYVAGFNVVALLRPAVAAGSALANAAALAAGALLVFVFLGSHPPTDEATVMLAPLVFSVGGAGYGAYACKEADRKTAQPTSEEDGT